MTAEETFLNDHLEAQGLEVVETDLGEWIIQLRHEGPSHMVMPAIHLSRQDVAELFTKVTGKPQEPDIGNLVKVARKELRKAFLTADMGISGANFAIAATCTLIRGKNFWQTLYMSGHSDDAIVHHGVLEPGIAFIQKPFRCAALLQKVREVLDPAEAHNYPNSP
jgi:hypothetical protein